ncbi:hypothetical protein NIES4102_41010 (plasmid) [Chondrocystis sp. NIES-4102]|nr:hypothetical protein NIES4102_41010 [Chondrocystis sp. NIES-4102]
MKKKVAVYFFATLLTSSAIASLISVNAVDANERKLAQTSPETSATPMESQMNASTQEVDRNFIEMMIPHHQGATEMAKMALDQAESPQVRELAQSIIEEQTREIAQMRNWYKQWYGTEVPVNSSSMEMNGGMNQEMKMSMQHQDMMEEEMMSALENADDFEREFLNQMIRHHSMASMMAGMVVNSAEHQEIRQLAQTIVRDQNEEIAQMRQMLAQAKK